MPKIKYDKYLILGILIAFFFDSRVDSRTGDEERLSANVYEQKSMIEAVFMSSKKSTVAIKMLLTATREQLTSTYPQKERYFILELYNLSTADKERPMLSLVLVRQGSIGTNRT